MQPFDYVVPKSHAEASALLVDGNGTVRPFMGGTDLLIRMRGGFVRPERVIDLKGLPGMRDIRLGEQGWLVIGAACTMNQVALHPLVQQHYDLLAQACNAVASYQLRNRATVGGNICNASPAADTAPALYCLDAVVELFGPGGARRVPIAEFFLGPGKTALRPGEFLTAIHLPPAPVRRTRRLRQARPDEGRRHLDGERGSAAGSIADSDRPNDESHPWSIVHRPIRNVRIALGAVGPTPLRAPEAEAALAEDASPDGVKRAADLAAAAAKPIDDIRASAAYRRAMVAVLVAPRHRGGARWLSVLRPPSSRPPAGGAA